MAQLTLSERIAAGRGERPADLILKNLRLVNVLTGEIYPTEIVIAGGYVVALGSGYSAAQEIDLGGRYVCPGFIDAHVHIESSLCAPPEFMRTVVPRGTTSVVTDPHEIANVLGLEGIRYMLDRARFGIGRVFLMASSCVPASHMETSGATLLAEDLVQLLDDPRVLGLAEVMSYPDVIHADPVVMAKIQAFAGRVIDGHSPAVTGQALNAYVTAGIMSDHECTTPEEALEKLRLGMHILIREGTTTRNLRPLLPMVTAENHHRLCFCTDDRQPGTLLDEGSVDSMVRTAIAEGLDPMMAIRMGSINTANYFRLHDLGAIVPGRRADMIVFSDLRNLQPEMVFSDGVQVGENGRALAEAVSLPPLTVSASMNVRPGALDFTIPANGTKVHVIGGLDDQVVTEHFIDDARIVDGQAVADPDRDLLKIAVIERHTGSGRIGKGF
ncbi:adenine deaminase, partial [Anaerolineae bacterium CFX9]|nr:adenine deaminase [Anaerolineae bacterium CFX9]